MRLQEKSMPHASCLVLSDGLVGNCRCHTEAIRRLASGASDFKYIILS